MVSVIVSTPNEWTFINNNNHFVVFWFVWSSFIRAQCKATKKCKLHIVRRIASELGFSISILIPTLWQLDNFACVCVCLHRSYFTLMATIAAAEATTTATIACARSFYFLNSLRFEQFDASHFFSCIYSLFMHCCPFTNICLLVMPYLLFIHGNCMKINTSTPMRCEQTVQSTFISSNGWNKKKYTNIDDDNRCES